MKPLIAVLIGLTLVFSVVSTSQSQVLWRDAETMDKGLAIIMAQVYYIGYNKTYDWTDEEWDDLPDGYKAYEWGIHNGIGYAFTDNWEMMLHIPVVGAYLETFGVSNSSAGLGDMALKTRYAVKPWTAECGGLTLLGTVRFPTGNEDADVPLGDGTTDFSFGAIYSTAQKSSLYGHMKANYWINGENSDKIKYGNELDLIFELDYNLSENFTMLASYSPQFVSKRKWDGNEVTNSEISRHYLELGCLFVVKGDNYIRPKVVLQVGGKGSLGFTAVPMIEYWSSGPLK